MATLQGRYPANTFKGLLNIDNNNAGIDATLRTVQDGEGTTCPLQLSSSGVNIVSGFTYNGSAISTTAALSFTGAVTTAGAFTTGGAVTFSGAFSTTITVTAGTTITLPTSGTLYGTASGSITSAQLATSLTDETGSGSAVFATSPTLSSPTLTTPVLGTPSSGNLSNCTAYPLAQLTGAGTGVLTFLATPSSANLAAALTDETGTGANVFANTPTLVTPILGTPTSGTLTNCTSIPVANATGILPIANGGTAVAASNPCIQIVRALGSPTVGTTILPFDISIPQNTEGDQYVSVTITPKNTNNILEIWVNAWLSSNAIQEMGVALFQDTTANALCAASSYLSDVNQNVCVSFVYAMTAGTTSATTFKVRAGGNNAGTTTFKGNNGSGIYGTAGAAEYNIIIKEYTA